MKAFLYAALAIGTAAGPLARAAEEQHLLAAPLTQAPGRELTALKVTFAPGQASTPHRHGGDAYVYVLSGRIRSQVEGEPAHVYGPGESWFEKAGAHHLGSANVSAAEPATILVVFIARPGARLSVPDQPSATPARTQSR